MGVVVAPAPRPVVPSLAVHGRKVSAVHGRDPAGTRPEMMSCRNAAWAGCSEAKETVVDASTYHEQEYTAYVVDEMRAQTRGDERVQQYRKHRVDLVLFSVVLWPYRK